MQSMLFCGVSHTVPQNDSVRTNQVSVFADRPARIRQFATFVFMIAIVAVLGACSAGSGGDNGVADSNPTSNNGFGLNFTYPFDGQQDVPRDTQMEVVFANAFQGDASDALRLQTGKGADEPTTPITVQQDANQPNILHIMTDDPLAPDTDYRVVANRRITDGDTFVNENVGLFSFHTRPLQGTPAPVSTGFVVEETTPGETNPATGRTTPFAAFNSLRVRFSEPVNPATVAQGQSFTFTGPSGDAVDGRLTVLGRNLTFDPTNDLAPGSYTLILTNAVTSQFGNSLTAYTKTKNVQGVGQTSTENTKVDPTASTISGLPDSPLKGTPDNVGTISTQLIGVNNQLARTPDDLNSVKTTLAQPGLFDDTLPAVIRAGQKVRLSKLVLSLNGDIPTPIVSGAIDTYFINDASVYIQANDLRNLPGPSAVRLRFDLGISTLSNPSDEAFSVESLANGLFNQTVLNVQAAGIAVAQPNGDLKISAVGSFPISVNRNEDATTDLALTLILPGGNQPAPQPDTTAPFLTAQSPSSCLYVFGLNDNAVYNGLFTQRGVAAPVLPEALCAAAVGGARATGEPLINSFPIEASPAVVFSEPLDPSSVNAGSVSLMGGGTSVPITTRVEGSSIVIDPVGLLTPNTNYTITLGSGQSITDLADGQSEAFDNGTDDPGNPFAFGTNPAGPNQLTLNFTTEPQSTQSDSPPLLGTLSPGIPCALTGGNFMTGQNNAGHCTGDMQNGTFPDLPVFQNPANVKVDAVFSELVQTDSIVLADGCLTAGGEQNTVSGASVAVQQMDGSGQCVRAVPGQIAFANEGDDVTRAFTFRPVVGFVPGTRYWIVVCGDTGNDAPGCTGNITDGTNILNTNPIAGTGSTAASTGSAGGPDLIMPFVATAPTINYYTAAFTLPETDTNGSGQYDDANGDGMFQDGDERPQPGNRSLVNLSTSLSGIDLSGLAPPTTPQPVIDLLTTLGPLIDALPAGALGDIPLNNPNRSDGAFPSYLALARPIALRGTLTGGNCNSLSAVTFDDNVTSAVGDIPDQCIQASLLPGGINSLTSINIGADVLTASLTGALGGGVASMDPTTPLAGIPVLGPLLATIPGGDTGTIGDLLNGTLGGLAGGGGLNAQTANNPQPAALIDDTPIGGLLPSEITDVVNQVAASSGGFTDNQVGQAIQMAIDNTTGGDSSALTPEQLTDLIQQVSDAGGGGGIPNGGLQNVTGVLTPIVTGLVNGLLDDLGLPTTGTGPTSPLQTGRIVLRFPNAANNVGLGGQPTQSGFIVEKCTGTFPGGPTYDFEPCFAASLQLVANAPDGQGTTVQQQRITANVVGPVAFEQNGRLVIAVRNVNTITLKATALSALPATATINPGDLNFQLVGNAVHGGRAFPSR